MSQPLGLTGIISIFCWNFAFQAFHLTLFQRMTHFMRFEKMCQSDNFYTFSVHKGWVSPKTIKQEQYQINM